VIERRDDHDDAANDVDRFERARFTVMASATMDIGA
jgi:hypothetical protein